MGMKRQPKGDGLNKGIYVKILKERMAKKEGFLAFGYFPSHFVHSIHIYARCG